MQVSTVRQSRPPHFLEGGGEMGAMIRDHDWSATLGPPQDWPDTLKSTLRLMLNSGHPMLIWWGPDLIQFYNDSHAQALTSDRHPAGLGQNAMAFWPELREIMTPQIEHVMSGKGATWRENQRIPLMRRGRVENSYWTYSYNPIPEPSAPNGVGGILLICRETTAIHAAERRQAFVLALEDRLRDLTQPGAVMATAAEMLGKHLHADRAGYSEIDSTGAHFTVEHDWCSPGMPSLAGRHRLADFGRPVVDTLRSGKIVRFDDVLTEALTTGDDVVAAYAAASSSAAITVPLIKNGRFAAALFVHQRTPRHWTEEDEKLVSDAAQRTWAAVERGRAEAALRESEAYWREMFNRLHEGFFLAQVIRDEHGRPSDWRYLDNNPSWQKQFGFTREQALGATIGQLDPTIRDEWIDLVARVVETGETVAFSRKAGKSGRWYEGRVFPTGPDQIAALFLDVTERKNAERQLRDSEERWRLALESGELGSWEMDLVAGVTRRSARHDKIFGYEIPLSATTYETFERHIVPEERASVAESFRNGIKSGLPWKVICRIERVDGVRRWVEGRCKPFADANGRVTRIIGTVADITEQREAQERLEALNDSLEREVARRTADRDRFWRLSQDLMLAVQYDGTIVAVNPAWTTRLGWTEEDLIGTKLFEFIHPEDVEASRSRRPQPGEGTTMWRFDNRYRRKNGTYRWISWTAVPGDGLVNAVGRDVTDDKAKTEALAQSEARLRSVFESSYQFQGLLTPDGEVLDANPVSLAAIHATLADVVGRPYWETAWFSATPVMAEQVKSAIDIVKKGGGVRQEITLNLPTGRRDFDLSMRPMVGSDGSIIGIVPEALEITERRAAEEQLRQSQKMEAVGQLTGGLAHDFNNLLAGIMGSLELLQNRVEQGRVNDLQRFIAGALDAASRAAALTHRLLAFSRRQTLDPKPTQANRLVAGMADLVNRTVGPAITMDTRLAPDLWPTLCDPNQLESAVLNLCINARDAMPDGGRLTIATENIHVDDAAARAMNVAVGDYIVVCVEDTGIGMPPDILARAFDPFFTTKPIGMGTGLGLSMIYGFARQSGGHAELSSRVGEGTHARILLPRHDAEPPREAGRLDLAAAPRAEAGETVLVVDDEALVRTLVTEVLEELGYNAIEAADGEEGLKILRSDLPIDLLISDVGLPGGMNGRQMADAARQTRPKLKVLFITGYADGAVVGRGQLDPGMHLITKPFAMDAMATRIKSIISDP